MAHSWRPEDNPITEEYLADLIQAYDDHFSAPVNSERLNDFMDAVRSEAYGRGYRDGIDPTRKDDDYFDD